MANPKSIFWILFAVSAVLLALPAVYSQDDSEIPLSCAPPSVIEIGRRYTIDVTFRNSGENVWTKDGGYGLGLIDVIGVECRGDEFNPEDSIAWNQTKTFRLSCIPIPGEEDKTTMVVRMSHSGEYFGETGMPCIKYFFKVVNNCKHGAINDMCNKYCGADERCHNYRNSTITAPGGGFCDEECLFLDQAPPGWGATTSTVTTSTSTTTIQRVIQCPEGYEYKEGLCVYYPSISTLCPPGSTYSQTYQSCITYPDAASICPTGYVLENDICIFHPASNADCPLGTTYSEQKKACVFYPGTKGLCPEGYELIDNVCIYESKSQVECPADSTYLVSLGACVVYPSGNACPEGYTLENNVCVYLLSKTCGNQLVEGNELCDYSSDISTWKSERSVCNKTMSLALKTCSRGCRPAYYAPRCVVGACGAECTDNSQCNDSDEKTTDLCDILSCKCNYLLKSAYRGSSSSSKIKLILKVLIVSLGLIAVILFAIYIRLKKKEVIKVKEEPQEKKE